MTYDEDNPHSARRESPDLFSRAAGEEAKQVAFKQARLTLSYALRFGNLTETESAALRSAQKSLTSIIK